MPIRFHLDEHIPSAVAAGLRRRNIDVTTSVEAGLVGADDPAQLAFATTSGRVLVTYDDDFLRLHNEGAAHAGIACCRGTVKIGEQLRRLVLIHSLLTPEEMVSRVEYL